MSEIKGKIARGAKQIMNTGKNIMLLLFLAGYADLAGQCTNETTDTMPEQLTVLSVRAENVRVRSLPYVEEPSKQLLEASKTVGRLDRGDIIVAEKIPFKGEGMSWYRIIGKVDRETGVVTDVLEAFPQAFSHPYVSADFVEPYNETHNFFTRTSNMPYFIGYSAIDHAIETQRTMTEQKTLKWCFPPEIDIPVYAKPSTSSEINGYYLKKHTWPYYEIIITDSLPGWVFVMDLATRGKSGWVQSEKLTIENTYNRIGYETAYLFILNIGANIREIVNRRGGKVAERTVEVGSAVFDDELYYMVSTNTLITADGFELSYEDHRNLLVTLTRKGNGLGGIAIGETWCNKAYIENAFGHLSIHKTNTSEGVELWSMDGGTDGWQFHIFVRFDKQETVSELRFSCGDVLLN